jgi:hypothetical protein
MINGFFIKNKIMINNIDRLKLMLEIKIIGNRSVSFKVIFIDEDINKNNDNDTLYTFNRFSITKGKEIYYTPFDFIIPTDILKDNFNKPSRYSFRCESNRKYLLKELSDNILKFIKNGSTYNNPNSRVKYMKDCWFFY